MKAAPALPDETIAVTVAEGEAGARLDKYLTDALAGKLEAAAPSRARIRH